jgi:antitoxin (DNA-binding transcriptional repressor) of toxin-antitoxin stability system
MLVVADSSPLVVLTMIGHIERRDPKSVEAPGTCGTLTVCHKVCHDEHMPSVNIRQLRDTRRLKAWLRAGKTVELRERNRLIARIVPALSPPSARKWPDFAARRKEIFGDRILPGADLVIQERGRY